MKNRSFSTLSMRSFLLFLTACLILPLQLLADSPGHTPPDPDPEPDEPCDKPTKSCVSMDKCIECKDPFESDPCKKGESGDPVRLVNGEFYWLRGFIAMKDGSFPLSFAVRYSTFANSYSAMGWGWAHSFNQRLYETDQNRIIIRDGLGKKRVFKLHSDNTTYVAISNNLDRVLINGDGTYTMQLDRDHQEWTFDAKGRLVSMLNEQGGEWRFTYTSEEKESVKVVPIRSNVDKALVVIRDWKVSQVKEYQGGVSTGRSYDFGYDTTSGLLKTVTTHAGEQLTLVHDFNTGNNYGLLNRIEAPGGAIDTYTYETGVTRYFDQYGMMKTFSNNACSLCSTRTNVFDSDGRVTRQYQGLNAEGEDVYFDYSQVENATTPFVTVTYKIQNIVEGTNGTFIGVNTGEEREERVYFTVNPYTNGKTVRMKVIKRGATWDALDNIVDDHVEALYEHDMVTNALGEVSRETTASGLVRNFTRTYHPDSTMASLTEVAELGNGITQTRVMIHDTSGHMISDTQSQSDRPGEEFITEYTYWAGTELKKDTKRKQADGNYLTTTNYYYNIGSGPSSSAEHTGLLAKTVTPLGNYTSYTYTECIMDGSGNCTQPGGLMASSATYDAADTSGSNPLASSSYTYDAIGNKTSSNINGITTFYEYDARNRQTRAYNQSGSDILRETVNVYVGSVLSEVRTGNPEYGYRAVKYGYNSVNNKISTSRLNTLLATATEEVPEANWDTQSYMVYDSVGNVRSVANALDQTTNYEYEPIGWRTSTTVPVSDGIDSVTTQTYDKAGRVITSTASNGTVTAYEYDARDRRTHTKLDYDSTAGTAYRTDVNSYDALGNIVSMAVYEGIDTSAAPYAETFYYFDRLGRNVGVNWNPANDDKSGDLQLPVKYVYDADGRASSIFDGEGRETSYTYDALGRALTTTHAPGTADEATQSVNYSLLGNITKSTDGRGIHRYTHHDELGRPTHSSIETNANWSDASTWINDITQLTTEVIEYSPWGEVRAMLNVDRVAVSNFYDAYGRLTQTVTPSSPSPITSYTDLDQVDEITYPAIGTTPETKISYNYDAANGVLVRSVTDRAGDTTGITYNESLQRASSTSSLNYPDGAATVYQYDALNRLSKTTNEAGNLTTTAYDVLGRTTTVYHPDHPYTAGEPDTSSSVGVEQLTYTTYSQVESKTGTGGYPIKFAYDLSGKMTSMWDNKNQASGAVFTGGTQTHWQYDNRGRLKKKYYDYGNGGNSRTDYLEYTYDDNSQPTSRRDGNGLITQYSYEPTRNLLQTINYPTDTDVQYVYDKAYRRTQMTDATGVTAWSYDSLGRLASCTQNSVDQSIHYAYDDWSRINDRRVRSVGAAQGSADEWLTEYSYDDAGRLQDLTDHKVSTTIPFTYTWNDNASLVASISMPSGARQDKAYDALGRLDLIEAYNQASTKINSFDYTYNSVSQREQVTLADGNKIDYTYDQKRQLNTAKKKDASNVQVTGYDFDYDFDAIGNRTSATQLNGETFTYTPNALNQYSLIDPSIGTADSPSYDDNGSLLSDGRITNTWNEESRLKVIIDSEKNTRSEYLYDGNGRRIERNDYNGTTSTTAIKTTRYLYEGWNCIADYDVLGSTLTLLKSYTWSMDLSGTMQGAGGVGGLLAITTDTGVSHEVTYDGNGNVSDLLDVTGTVTAHYEYDPFGNTISQSGYFVDENTYRFSTKPINTHAGELYYYGYRYYDPVTGRWPNRDPIKERGGLNLYSFVGNNALNWWDYLGLETISGKVKDGSVVTINYKFDAEFDKKNCVLLLRVNIEVAGFDLSKDSDDTKNFTKLSKRIQKEFKNRKLKPDNPDDEDCCCEEIELGFVVYLTNNTKVKPHHNVKKGVGWSGRADMLHWGDLNPDVMLHEIIHMFGVKDEYLDELAYPEKKTLPKDAKDGVMGNAKKPILDRHIDEIVDRAQKKLKDLKGCEISL